MTPESASSDAGDAMAGPQERFDALGLVLPLAPKPAGAYKPFLVQGRRAYVSGHLPVGSDGKLIVGRVGDDLDVEAGRLAARQAGLAILATLLANVGQLGGVRRVVKVLGMVSSGSGFGRQPDVLNGCSQLFAAVWGEDFGVGVRSAVGVGSLPGGAAVEVEAMFELA